MRVLALLAIVALPLAAQRPRDLDSFEKVWTIVRDKHWQEKPAGLDWQAIHAEFRPRAEQAKNDDQMRAVIREMLGRLQQTHFAIVPGNVYALLSESGGEGVPGMDVRILEGVPVVVRVDPGSGAEKAGVKPGWAILSADGVELAPLIAHASADPAIHELQLTRSVVAKLTGNPGGTIRITFEDGSGNRMNREITLGPERGDLTTFGNLPPQHVWFESRQIGRTLYVRFNVFLDVVRIISGFQKALDACHPCDGVVLDLRGNPGGIGGMAMGLSGFLIDTPGQKLGTMYLRDTTLNFVVNPRPQVFEGPVAVLVDGLSASTSEILAGGLHDLGRARIFGTHTAAAALPSNFERLPNGDGFQYAVANYVSQGGKPLEGFGVTPDQEVKLTRAALLSGHDPVIDAALAWIGMQKGSRP